MPGPWHGCRNVIAKVPGPGRVKRDFWFDAVEADGTAAEAEARRRAARLIAKYKPLYPAAAAR
jgi:hypothetical protein